MSKIPTCPECGHTVVQVNVMATAVIRNGAYSVSNEDIAVDDDADMDCLECGQSDRMRYFLGDKRSDDVKNDTAS